MPEIGYWFGVRYWGRGYATEAAQALVDHAFGDLGREVLHAGARVSNPASRRVLEKCGFQWTGVVLQRSRALGSSVPCDRFVLDRGSVGGAIGIGATSRKKLKRPRRRLLTLFLEWNRLISASGLAPARS